MAKRRPKRTYEKRRRKKGSTLYPYKSRLEKSLHEKALKEYEYEPKSGKTPYAVEHEYNPDFIHPSQPNVLVEAKGYMQNGSADCKKYVAIAKCNPELELVFVFSRPEAKAYPQCRRRKDGTFLSLAEWCDKNNFLYFSTGTVPKDLAKGKLTVSDLRRLKEKRRGKTTSK